LPVRKTGSPTITPAKQINIKMFLFLILYMFLHKLELSRNHFANE
jgi:hypothetical protein